MSHQRRRPFLVLSRKTRRHRGSLQHRTRPSSPAISESAPSSTIGIISAAKASPPATKFRVYTPSGEISRRRVPALRPRTRLISATASVRASLETAPCSASARRALRTRRASSSAAVAPAGCCSARRMIATRRSWSMTPTAANHSSMVPKSRSASRRTPSSMSSVLTKSSQRRSPTKMNVRRSDGATTSADTGTFTEGIIRRYPRNALAQATGAVSGCAWRPLGRRLLPGILARSLAHHRGRTPERGSALARLPTLPVTEYRLPVASECPPMMRRWSRATVPARRHVSSMRRESSAVPVSLQM